MRFRKATLAGVADGKWRAWRATGERSQSACVSTGAAGTAARRAQSRDGEGRRRAYDTAGPRRNGSINKTSSPFRRTAKFDGLQENNVVGIERLRWEMP